MKHKMITALTLLLGFTLQGLAQETKTISLKEAVELSLQNNKQLKINQAKIDESIAAVKEAKEKKLPGASVSGAYMRLSSANIDMKSSSSSGGGQSGESPSPNQAMYGILNVSQPLYSGGKIRYGIQSAEYLEKATRLDAASQQDEVIQNTLEAFANLFKANTAVILVKENLEQNQQRVKDLTNLEKNGLLARNDLLKAQLQQSNVELSLLDAENNLDIANLNMNILLGLPDNTKLQLDTTGIEKKNDSRSVDEYVQSALTNRKDKEALGYRLKSAELGVKIANAEKMPNLNLTGGYIAADIPKVLSITNAVNVGVGVSYNIASLWKTKSKVDQAKSRVKQLELTESILDDNVRLQVNKNYSSLISYRKKIEVMDKAKEQANENYRIVKNKFDNQLATTTDLLEADVAKLQASMNYTLARADAFVAYNKLLLAAGTLSQDINK
ncbi:MAG: TolC family protein [Ferruginibacter sp.]